MLPSVLLPWYFDCKVHGSEFMLPNSLQESGSNGQKWVRQGEGRRAGAAKGGAGGAEAMIGQPPNIEFRLSRSDQCVLQVFLPPAALLWLDDHQLGLEHMMQAVSSSALDHLLPREPIVFMPAPAPPGIELRDRDNSLLVPGTIFLEAWLRGHPGTTSVRALVQAIYGVAESEAESTLYERRGVKGRKAGTKFYRNFMKDFQGALSALQVDGWTITPARSAGKAGERNLWAFTPPQATALESAVSA